MTIELISSNAFLQPLCGFQCSTNFQFSAQRKKISRSHGKPSGILAKSIWALSPSREVGFLIDILLSRSFYVAHQDIDQTMKSPLLETQVALH
jgi:hypothetical protein